MTGGAIRVGKIPVEDCGRCASYTSMTGGAADRLLELQYHSGIEFQPNRSLLHIEHGGLDHRNVLRYRYRDGRCQNGECEE